VALAAELNMARVIVPRAAEVFSAWGMLMSELRRDYFVTRLLSFDAAHVSVINPQLEEITVTVLAQFATEGVDARRVRFQRFAKLRYENQEHSVEVALPDGAMDGVASAAVTAAFHAVYEREYTYRLDAAVEFVGLHLVARADVGKLEPMKLPRTGRALQAACKGRREVDYALEGRHAADIYDGEVLEPGMGFSGPSVIEMRGTTVLVHPNNRVHVDDYGNIHIQLAPAAVSGDSV
jgi:N-methylhydantoinase A